MARHNRLRTPRHERPAKAGLLDVQQSFSPVHLAAILTILAAGFLVVWQLAGFGGEAQAAPKSLTRALSEPQSSAPLVRSPRLRLRLNNREGGDATARVIPHRAKRWQSDSSANLDPSSRLDGSIVVTDRTAYSDLRLLQVAILTGLGVNMTPAGLASKLKRRSGGQGGPTLVLDLDDSTFPVPYAVDPTIGASSVTTNEIAGSTKVLDLSRPIRAGPGSAQTINTRAAASSDLNGV
jgi:hypothetical protein